MCKNYSTTSLYVILYEYYDLANSDFNSYFICYSKIENETNC